MFRFRLSLNVFKKNYLPLMAMANHTDISVHRNEGKLDSQTVCPPGHLVNYWHIGPCWLDLLHIGKLKGQKKIYISNTNYTIKKCPLLY